tara:strand:- start:1726 stop:2022 length:297 start_codon:yes stop_codon:yes gene_type:complete
MQTTAPRRGFVESFSDRMARFQWAYKGDWKHLERLGWPLASFFRSLPEWARPCPMSVDLMRVVGQLGTIFVASSLLMRTPKPSLAKPPASAAADDPGT